MRPGVRTADEATDEIELPTTALPGPLPSAAGLNLLFVGVLYLITTSRWGSYVSPPGLPLFVGDVLLLAGSVQALHLVWRQRRALGGGRVLETTPLFLLLTLSLLALTALRAVLGLAELVAAPLVGLRDLAPYAYAVAALVAFVMPVTDRRPTRVWVFAALSAHLLWLEGATYLPGWPQHWPELGGAAVLTPRPDFDTAVVGVGLALALHHAMHHRPHGRWAIAGLALFIGASGFALLASPTRAGLLSGLVASGVVVFSRLLRHRTGPRLPSRARAGALIALLAVVSGLLALTPSGHRLAESVQGQQSNASGTTNARLLAWRTVDRYVLADARRTAIGVGFGPDFLTDSGATYLLEGEEYENVRSPHNYLIGAFARLGLAGMLLAGLMLASAALAAVRALARPVGTATALAALLVLALPVTALLGVVLESPFGAIPYFWAVGQLARHTWSARRTDPVHAPLVTNQR